VHQCACFAVNPKECHVQAMLHIDRYLHATNKPQSFDLWCNADFSRNWSPETAQTYQLPNQGWDLLSFLLGAL